MGYRLGFAVENGTGRMSSRRHRQSPTGRKSCGKRSAGKAAPIETAGAAEPAPLAIDERMQALEATVAELQSQMLASSELITALASQNAELVKRAEANRVRLLWLSVVVAVLAVSAVSATGAERSGVATVPQRIWRKSMPATVSSSA